MFGGDSLAIRFLTPCFRYYCNYLFFHVILRLPDSILVNSSPHLSHYGRALAFICLSRFVHLLIGYLSLPLVASRLGSISLTLSSFRRRIRRRSTSGFASGVFSVRVASRGCADHWPSLVSVLRFRRSFAPRVASRVVSVHWLRFSPSFASVRVRGLRRLDGVSGGSSSCCRLVVSPPLGRRRRYASVTSPPPFRRFAFAGASWLRSGLAASLFSAASPFASRLSSLHFSVSTFSLPPRRAFGRALPSPLRAYAAPLRPLSAAVRLGSLASLLSTRQDELARTVVSVRPCLAWQSDGRPFLLRRSSSIYGRSSASTLSPRRVSAFLRRLAARAGARFRASPRLRRFVASQYCSFAQTRWVSLRLPARLVDGVSFSPGPADFSAAPSVASLTFFASTGLRRLDAFLRGRLSPT